MRDEMRRAPAARRMTVVAAGLIAACVVPPAPAAAQNASSNGSGDQIYRREVYQYPRGVRPDPFRSLLGSVDMGLRVEDLALRGIVYNDDPRESVAILVERSSSRRIRARVGERVGALTVVAIHPRRIDVVVEDFGVPRRESLYLRADTENGNQS